MTCGWSAARVGDQVGHRDHDGGSDEAAERRVDDVFPASWPAQAVKSTTSSQGSERFGAESWMSRYWVHSLTMTNTSAAQLVLSTLALTGPDATDLWGVNDGAIGHCNDSTVLAPGESCAIWVTFTPRAAGPKTAAVSITSSASPTPSLVP